MEDEKYAVLVVVVPYTNENIEGISGFASNVEEYVVLDNEGEAIAEAFDLARR